MLLFLVLCPIVAAILIIAGASARLTALIAAIANLLTTLFILIRFDRIGGGFQFVSSFVVSTDWRIHFANRSHSALPKRPTARANFRHSRITKLDCCSSVRRFRSATYLSFVAAWLRHSHLALSISFLGARGLRIRARARRDVARRRS